MRKICNYKGLVKRSLLVVVKRVVMSSAPVMSAGAGGGFTEVRAVEIVVKDENSKSCPITLFASSILVFHAWISSRFEAIGLGDSVPIRSGNPSRSGTAAGFRHTFSPGYTARWYISGVRAA